MAKHLEPHQPARTAPACRPARPRPAAADLRDAFEGGSDLTVGIEEELMLVNPETLLLAPEVERVLALLGGDPRFAPELRVAQLEIVTPVCVTVSLAVRELAAARRRVLEVLDGELLLVAAGTHPFSTDWGAVTDAERYRTMADEYPWAARRSLACGLHVHVAVSGPDRALAVFNALRSHLPEIGALAANSPFYQGADTGLCSVRPKLNEALPRTGVPPAFASWDDLAGFVAWGRSGGLFPDASHLWWDLRLHPLHGTIELRVADAQTRLEDAAGVAALFQALAVSLAERYDRGEPLTVHDTHRIAENAWRGLRYGVDGWLVDLNSGEAEPTRDRLARLLRGLAPTAERLESGVELAGAGALLAGNGADRQRSVARREGLDGLVRRLAVETAASAFDELGRAAVADV